MTYTTLDYIVKQIETLPAVVWHVKANETTREYIARQDDETMSPEASAGLLVDALSNLVSGNVHVTLSKRPFLEVKNSTDKYAGIYKYNYQVPRKRIDPPQLQQPPQNIGSSVPLAQYLDAIQQCNELRLENHTLKQKISDLENEGSESLTTMLMPVLMEIAKNPMPAISAIGQIFNPKKENTNGNV